MNALCQAGRLAIGRTIGQGSQQGGRELAQIREALHDQLEHVAVFAVQPDINSGHLGGQGLPIYLTILNAR